MLILIDYNENEKAYILESFLEAPPVTVPFVFGRLQFYKKLITNILKKNNGEGVNSKNTNDKSVWYICS